jgi:hypothetical protein
MINTRVATRLAGGAWGTSLILVILALILPRVISRSAGGVELYGYWAVVVIAPVFATVGMLIATRRPDHLIGWLFVSVGLLGTMQFSTGQYAVVSLAAHRGMLPGGGLAAWLSTQAQLLAVTSLVLLLLLFPTGHVPSRPWRLVAWVLALASGLGCITEGIRPGPLTMFPAIENPFGIAGTAKVAGTLTRVIDPLLLLGALGAVASLLVRLRHAQGVERQQLKWFVYAATLGIVVIVGGNLLLPEQMNNDAIGNLVWAIAFDSLAVATTVAILRYRLYDIDVLINRTLVYGALTALLTGVFVSLVVVSREVVEIFTGQRQSELAIVASTLAIAALFNPLRRRIQDFIDRRFYRRKYDAAQVLAAFSMTARDEVDLDRLSNELLAVIEETLQPAHVSLWLREPEQSSKTS